MLSRPARLGLVPRLVTFAFAVYAFFWISGFPREYDEEELAASAQRPKAGGEEHAVEYDQVIVSVKTTAPDAHTKLPPLLVLTHRRDYDSLLLMGDLQMNIGAFYVHNVMDKYLPERISGNEDLKRYRRQQEFARKSIPFSKLRESNKAKERESLAVLDKYKILPMLEKTWETRPDRKWYVFIEPDTYLVRANLLSFLGRFDSTEPMFFANPPVEDLSDSLGFGGSTFILSHAAMHTLFKERKHIVSDYYSQIAERSTAFDVLTSMLSTELSLGLNTTWPSIAGFNPATAPYGPGLWCDTVMAMHSMPTDLASDVWRLERDRQEYHHLKDPLLFADLWLRFMQPEDLDEPREDWDNLSSAPEYADWNILFESAKPDPHHHQHSEEEQGAQSGEASWQACQDSCIDHVHCMQWSYSSLPAPNHNQNGDTKCHLSRAMMFGAHAQPRDVDAGGEKKARSWKSGWRKEKFSVWAKAQKCGDQQHN